MNKAAPSLPRILVMVVFALSCFGLLLFLWLSFGGPVPLKPKGYRVQIDFPEATTLATEADVRVAGVPVGKVRKVEVGDGTNRTVATVELERRYAPLRTRRARRPAPEDAARRDLRRADAGRVGEDDPRGREAAATARSSRPSSSTRSSTRSTRQTRAAFKGWQTELAKGIKGRGRDFNDALGTLPGFASRRRRRARGARHAGGRGQRLVKNTGVVFGALTAERGAAAQPDHGLQAHVRRDGVQERRAGRDDPDLPDLPAGVQADARARAAVLDRHRPADHRPAPGRPRPAADAARRARAGAGPRALLPRTSTR